MVLRITTSELIQTLPDLLSQIHASGETVQIERDGEVIATIVPSAPAKEITWKEFASRYVELPRPDKDFADDVRSIRDTHLPIELPEWPS